MKIVSIVNTNYSLPFDDRVNKECHSLIKQGHKVDIIALENTNLNSNGITNYGAHFQILKLLSRKYFSSGKFVPLKLLEWNIRIIRILFFKKWDVLWVNDFDSILVIIYAKLIKIIHTNRKIVWDHHELFPDRLIKSKIYQLLLSFCDLIIHANIDRVEYTLSKISNKNQSKYCVLENYPNTAFLEVEVQSLNIDFYNWLNGSEYCLFQGSALTYRKVVECIDAIYQVDNVKLLIMGPCDDKTMNLIQSRWPSYKDKVFITGWISQVHFFQYMDKAIASLVFYENIDTNHWLCAPNRFFNAILREIPVISGPNPPMKRIVEGDRIGIICENNGENVSEISSAINTVKNQNLEFKSRCHDVKYKYTWESQQQFFEKI